MNEFHDYVDEFAEYFGGEVVATESDVKQRTSQQNRALHKWFRLLATELNKRGVDMRHFITKPIQADEHIVKETIWKPVMQAWTGKDSTTGMNTKQVSEVWEILNKHLGEKHGIHIPFPENEQE